jgi:hypothetical protein
MATLLDAPRPAAKVEEFVEKQLAAARRRVRVLDFFLAGLSLAVGSLILLLAALLVDRYVEMPRGTWWGILAGYVALATGYVYITLFHPNRRQINPYFVARQVERKVQDAKNSLVTYVDFEEDAKLPGSIKTAISQKAARDIKKVDLNRAIENRKILWLAATAGVFLLACAVVAFLPPTRTELTLEQPKNGDITVFNNQEVTFEVHVHGRIPRPSDPDAVRLRMWYNPDDPDNYEDRPLKPADTDRRQFSITVPPKQVRNGFRYRLLAGNTQTSEYTVTCKIIPEFTTFDVGYQYPAYLKQEPTRTNDPNLIAPYGTVATLTVGTNREVKHGHIEIEGQPRTIDGQLIEGQPNAIRFTVPMVKDGFFRIWYTTPEGDRNQDPARLRMVVIDPKPAIRSFDISYEYPAYLRFKPMSVVDIREPEIEAPRGSKVVLTAKTTRGVKGAKLELEGHAPVIGEPVEDQPMWFRFRLPVIDNDNTAKITFTPTTGEPASAPREIPVRAQIDQPPSVQITQPDKDLVEIPANGTLDLKGDATDDHGVDKMTLRMKVADTDRDLKPKPYRNGISFLRKEDNSWPTKVDYKDFVKLPDLRFEREPNARVMPGMEIEYWLEAVDNCTVPRPNVGESKKPRQRFKVIAPVTKPEEQRKIEQQNQKREKDQQAHEKRQDRKNETEKRDVQQRPPKGAEHQPDKNNPQQGNPDKAIPPEAKTEPNAKPQDMGQDGMGEPKNDMNPPEGNPDQDSQTKQVEKAIQNAEEEKNGAGSKSGPNQAGNSKVDPGDAKPQPKAGPMDPPPAGDHQPKENPNKDQTGDGSAGGSRAGKVDNTKDEKADSKDGGMPESGTTSEEKGGTRQAFGGSSNDAAQEKPAPKAEPKKGTEPKGSPEKVADDKGGAHPEKKPDATEPKTSTSSAKGGNKPEKDVTPAATKKPEGDGGPTGSRPPSDAAAEKPKDGPETGGSRQTPKKDELTDQGGSRTGPKDGSAGEERPRKDPMNGGSKDDVAKGGSKSGPGSPPGEPNAEQGELDREMGELQREINSTNPKVDEKKKALADQLMRNPKTREQTRKKLDEMEKNAQDELQKKKAHDLRESGEQAAKNYDNERPSEENVDKLSKNLNSDNKQDRQDAEQRIKDWQNNPDTKKELEQKADELAKKNPEAGKQLKDAMQKNDQARGQSGNSGEPQKLDDKDLQQMAKDLNRSDEKARADAQRKMEQAAKDPKSAKEMQDKLNEMAKNAQGQDKRDLENAAKQAGQMVDQMAKKEPGPKPDQNLDPKELKDLADKMANGDENAKQEARDRLKKLMQDPKAAKEAQDKLQEMANNAKTEEDKKALEDAAKAAQQMAKDTGPNDKAGPKREDLKDIADKMAGQDEKAKQDAKQKLNEMMKDPKTRDEAMKQLEEMAKNAKPEDQKNLQDALKQAAEMAKNQPTPDAKDLQNLQDLAKQLDKMDPEAKEKLRKQMEEAMKDPKTADALKKAAEEMAKKPKTPEEQKEFDNLMNTLGAGFKEIPGTPDPADPRNKLKSAELLLEKFKKDKTVQEKLNWTPEQIDKWVKDQEALIASLRRQLEKGDWQRNRTAVVPGGGPVSPKLDPKGPSITGGGSRYAPPSGYADPYKKFTTEQSGGAKAPEPKK